MPSRFSLSTILTLFLRFLQALFSIIVLGISASLAATQKWGSTPKLVCFAALAGLVSLLSSIFFAAATVRPFLRPKLAIVGDGVVLLLNLVVGTVAALRYHTLSCHNTEALLKKMDNIICAGLHEIRFDGSKYHACYYVYADDLAAMTRRCIMVKVDNGFLLATAGIMGVIGVLMYTWKDQVWREGRVGLDGM